MIEDLIHKVRRRIQQWERLEGFVECEDNEMHVGVRAHQNISLTQVYERIFTHQRVTLHARIALPDFSLDAYVAQDDRGASIALIGPEDTPKAPIDTYTHTLAKALAAPDALAQFTTSCARNHLYAHTSSLSWTGQDAVLRLVADQHFVCLGLATPLRAPQIKKLFDAVRCLDAYA